MLPISATILLVGALLLAVYGIVKEPAGRIAYLAVLLLAIGLLLLRV